MKRTAALFVVLIMFVTIFSGCGLNNSEATTTTVTETTTVNYNQKGVGNFQLGTWSNNVFTNTWSNIQIVLPSDCKYLSYKDLKSDNEDKDTAVNGDDLISAINSGKTNFVDGCIVLSDGVSNIIMVYDTDCNVISPKAYQTIVKNEFSNDDNFVFTGYSDETIAGRTFNKASYADVEDGFTMYMDNYLRKIDDSMFIIVAIYIDDSKAELTNLFNSMTDTSSPATTTSNRASPKIQN